MSTSLRYLVRKSVAVLLAVAACAAGLQFSARPASALPPTQGYGWLVRAGNGSVSSYNSSGQSVVLQHVATGRWDIAFAGQPQNPYGTPMVSAGNGTPGAICSIEQYF